MVVAEWAITASVQLHIMQWFRRSSGLLLSRKTDIQPCMLRWYKAEDGKLFSGLPLTLIVIVSLWIYFFVRMYLPYQRCFSWVTEGEIHLNTASTMWGAALRDLGSPPHVTDLSSFSHFTLLTGSVLPRSGPNPLSENTVQVTTKWN